MSVSSANRGVSVAVGPPLLHTGSFGRYAPNPSRCIRHMIIYILAKAGIINCAGRVGSENLEGWVRMIGHEGSDAMRPDGINGLKAFSWGTEARRILEGIVSNADFGTESVWSRGRS